MEPITAIMEPRENIEMDLADKLSERLVEVESGCWEFIGGRTGAGYGAISLSHTKQRSAHVLSYELTKGPIPYGLIVCHSCDNKICCNPAHLFLGTYQDNKDDEITKGRHAKGSRQGNSKLKENDVLEIRKLINQGYTLKHIGALYNITGEAIGLIKSRKNWGWLQ